MRLQLLASLVAAGGAYGAQNTQLKKVVQMLQDMARKGTKRLQEEQVAYAKFSQHCEGETGRLANEIADLAADIKENKANAAKSDADAAKLSDEIAQHESNAVAADAEKKKLTKERNAARQANNEEAQDFSESVDALARAVSIIKKQAHDRDQAKGAFMQIPDRAKALVQAFYQQDGEADGYEFQSGGILEMLKKLKGEFKDKYEQSLTEERNAQHAFELVMEDLTHQFNTNNKAADEKKIAMQQAKKSAAKSRKLLAVAEEDHKDNSTTLADLKTECTQKALSFEEKQKLAADEQEAIAEAVKILNQVGGASFLQTRKAVSLLQIRSSKKNVKDTAQVMSFLSSESMKIQSKDLAMLVTRMGEGPFDKVIGLVKNMISKLKKQKQEDAEKHAYCENEIAVSKKDRERLNADLDQLTADFDEATSSAAMLKEQITKLHAELTALDQLVAEQTADHTENVERLKKTVEESKGAQEAVAAARAVLTEFYAKATTATAFIQMQTQPVMGSDEWNSLANPGFQGGGAGYGQGSEDKTDTGHQEGMQTFGDTNQGAQDSNTGVIAMLDVILSDFARAEAEASTEMDERNAEYEKAMTDAKRTKKVKEKKVEMSEADLNDETQNAAKAKENIESTNDMLAAAERQWKSIQEQCITKPVTFEDRSAKRQKEIAALKEALEMLTQ